MARILVIDDEIQIRKFLREILERAGYEVIDAPDGQAGVIRYRQNPTDLIITDLIMPDKEGIETIRELRRDFPDVKIIAISGGGQLTGPNTYLKIAQKLGALRTFTKPLDRRKLIEAVREIIGQ